MKLFLGLAAALLCACAAVPARSPREAPLSETGTYGPSRVIYVH